MNYDLSSLMKNDGFLCSSCGKRHYGLLRDYIAERGAIQKLPALLQKYGVSHPFVLCDENTYAAAGEAVCSTLDENGVAYTLHVVRREKPAPDERLVGEALMYCDNFCDGTVAVGSGVIGDVCKILAAAKSVPAVTVATAPSMDGFASASSSMERGGLKVSLSSKCPDAVIADPAILSKAPRHMILSGIGDILAKYISLVEWKIATLLVGDDYCETVASIVREALKKCVKNAEAAVNGSEDAVIAVMEGLVISGLAMNYAGISRPASGMEHYISHITDMRALAFGTPADLHGIQCGIATLTTVRAYEALASETPNPEKALAAVRAWNNDKWNAYLTEKLGEGAHAIIKGEEKERKYDAAKHEARLKRILAHWNDILSILATLPKAAELEGFMKRIGHPTAPREFGLSDEAWNEAFLMAKDIRDKYVLGRLLWDLGSEDMHRLGAN